MSTKLTKWLNGSQLMERWGIDALDLKELICGKGLKTYDTFESQWYPQSFFNGEIRGYVPERVKKYLDWVSNFPIDIQKNHMRLFRFTLTDIEEFEKKHPELKVKTSETPQQEKSSETSDVSSVLDSEENFFRNMGDFWNICYKGKTIHLNDMKGLHYIAELLRNPGREINIKRLVSGINKIQIDKSDEFDDISEEKLKEQGMHIASQKYENEIIDKEAKKQYKSQYLKLKDDLEIARETGDEKREKEIEYEMEMLAEQINTAKGLNGKVRKFTSQDESARSSVYQCIKRASKNISTKIPPLGKHLKKTIQTGYNCSYNPNPDELIPWKF